MSSPASVVTLRRLLLGVMPTDNLTLGDLSFPVRVEIESGSGHVSSLAQGQYSHSQYPLTNQVQGFTRHSAGRYSLHYYPGATEQIIVRIYDLQRRYIPRRLEIPLVTLEQIETAEQNESVDYMQGRVKHPVMFPGAAYPTHGRMTGLRGRVVQGGEVVRWAFIELRSAADNSQILARARGDERGEFLMILPPAAIPDVSLSETVNFAIQVWAYPTPPIPDNEQLPFRDPYWDLPLESVVDAQADDEVTLGNVIPGEYVASQGVETVSFELARILTGVSVDDIEFSPL